MLSEAQKRQFEADGFLVLPSLLSPQEVAVLQAETSRIFGLQRPEVVRTEHGEPRVALAMERYSEPFRQLLRHQRVCEVSRDILGTAAFYNHQYKIVTKQPFGSTSMPWHQDYGSWRNIDGMPQPKAITIGIYLEEVSEFNGPLVFIPGSHRDGLLKGGLKVLPGRSSPSVMLDEDAVRQHYERGGAVAPKGPAGTAIVFHPLLVHGSGPNLSPHWRHIVYISPNPVDNHLVNPGREEMLASRDFSPMVAEVEAIA